MLTKKLVIAGAGVAVILGGGAVVLDQMAQKPVTSSSSQADPGPAPSGEPGPPASNGANPTDSPDVDGGASPGVDASAPADDGATAGEFLEVLPPVSASPTGLPMQPLPALISGPLPAAASAQGKVVDGFPATLMTFPEGTVLVSTSVSSDGEALQVSADGITGLNMDQVLGHFQQTLQPFDFRSESAPAADGQTAVRLSRGGDSITVSTSVTGTGSTRFSLLGRLHAAPGQ